MDDDPRQPASIHADELVGIPRYPTATNHIEAAQLHWTD